MSHWTPRSHSICLRYQLQRVGRISGVTMARTETPLIKMACTVWHCSIVATTKSQYSRSFSPALFLFQLLWSGNTHFYSLFIRGQLPVLLFVLIRYVKRCFHILQLSIQHREVEWTDIIMLQRINDSSNAHNHILYAINAIPCRSDALFSPRISFGQIQRTRITHLQHLCVVVTAAGTHAICERGVIYGSRIAWKMTLPMNHLIRHIA